ncbi:MAG: zinc-ribbon and DUF3426 domain-containing protein [Cycloclasticus sp.]|nr:zinc-ribbon and DUF3426 domain-containing protein [Cycloclasticus sp.]MBQ0789927.1 zinc-ribbon and DUF3426 domain-containing protein [Cycloclasticus sp.]
MHYARCPDCLTTLQITEQQLSLKAGLVRCGHCQQVFNAHDNKITPVSRAPIDIDDPTVSAQAKPDLKDAVLGQADPSLSAAAWETSKAPFIRSLPYGLLCFLSVLLLLTQFVYHQADTLTQNSSLQPAFKRLNSAFNLNIPGYKNLDEILVLHRKLSPHSNLKDTLELQLTIKNSALVEQDFPNIHISLSSKTGETVANGQFSKSDYLAKDDIHDFFEANEVKQFSLLFKKPLQQAVGFEISFSE